MLLGTVAILERMGLLGIAEEALIQTASVTCMARLSIPTTREAVIRGHFALFSEDVTPINPLVSFRVVLAIAALDVEEG